jgi:hypothetical protein
LGELNRLNRDFKACDIDCLLSQQAQSTIAMAGFRSRASFQFGFRIAHHIAAQQ